MQTGWYKLPATATASEATAEANTAAAYQYYDPDNGARVNGWKNIEGIAGLSEEGETYTFYFKNGAPTSAANGLELFTIDSKKYAFKKCRLD